MNRPLRKLGVHGRAVTVLETPYEPAPPRIPRTYTFEQLRELFGEGELVSYLLDEIERLGKIADALLAHCDKEGGECSECSRIVCPSADPLHFHHDGCPSCAAESADG